jgi:hypothetical protein
MAFRAKHVVRQRFTCEAGLNDLAFMYQEVVASPEEACRALPVLERAWWAGMHKPISAVLQPLRESIGKRLVRR